MQEYDYEEWCDIAESFYEREEIEDFFEYNDLIGKTIKSLRFVGISFHHTEYISCPLKDLDPSISDPEKRYTYIGDVSDDVVEERHSDIYEPFIIEFSEGINLEFMWNEKSGFMFSLNEIPENPESIGVRNVDANVLFSTALGKKITGLEFENSKFYSEFVKVMYICLSDGTRFRISDFYDLCCLSLVDRNDEFLPIKISEFRKGISYIPVD